MKDADARLAGLNERYRASLPIKRAGVELAWQTYCANAGSPVSLEGLQRIVHRIAGSAPSYGYPAIGALASEADEQLDRLRLAGRSARGNQGGAADSCGLEHVVTRLLAALSAADP